MGGIQLPIGLPPDGEDLSWQSESRCAKPDVDPEWWFAQDRKLKGPALKTAFALCVTCPVLDQCKRWTLKTDKELPFEMIHGIQGGLRRQERLAAKRDKDTQCDGRCAHCSKRLRPRHVLEEDSPGTVEMGDPNHCIPCLTVELSKEYPYCGNTPGVEAHYMFSGLSPQDFGISTEEAILTLGSKMTRASMLSRDEREKKQKEERIAQAWDKVRARAAMLAKKREMEEKRKAKKKK